MHIVDGEGAGSVVETHATPMGPGPDGRPRTAVIEAVIAQSDRTGFQYSLRAAPLITSADEAGGHPAVARRPGLRRTPICTARQLR